MSWYREQIKAANRRIAALEGGQRRDWTRALGRLGLTDISTVSDPFGFVAEMYCRFAVLRAGAEHFANQKHGLVETWAMWARSQRVQIYRLLNQYDDFDSENPLEQAGAFFIEETCRWGLKFIDEELSGWGY